LNKGRILYVSLGQGIHDQRFVKCAYENGWLVTTLRCDGKSNIDLKDAESRNWIGNSQLISRDNRHIFQAEFVGIVKEIKPNLVQVGPLSNAAAVLVQNLGVPILAVSWAYDLLYDVNESDWSKQVAISAIQLSDHIITDCIAVRKVAIMLGANEESISTIPWGVDLDQFNFSTGLDRNSHFSILSLRTLEPLYSVSTLLQAVRNLKIFETDQSLKVVVAGTGSQENQLRSFTEKHGLADSVKFVGHIPECDLQDEFLKHDLYVSTSPVDGSSISMLQSMSSGLPCLVPNIPSNREWIKHKYNGLLYKSQDSKALADSINEVVHNSRMLATYARNARSTIEARANWRSGSEKIADILAKTAS
jgi:glycosyltransferase involved in cell wall biosynthesis